MADISLSTTLVAKTKARAAQVNQMFDDIIDGLTDGTKDIDVNDIDCVDLTSTGSLSDNENYSFDKTGTVAGATVSDITVPDNTGLIISVFGSGLKAGNMSIFNGEWILYRTTGVCTINQYRSDRDGADAGPYLNVVADGNDILIKAYSDAGTWLVKGRVNIRVNNTLTIA